jgi:hypothetical protein
LGSSAAGAAVETHVVHGCVVYDDGLVYIYVGEVGAAAYVHDRGVVKECAAAPFPAAESHTAESKAVVNASIETDVRSPVAAVPGIVSIYPAPVAGRPEQAWSWRRNPGSRNPVIAFVSPSPVSWCPHVARLRANRLYING